MLALIVQAIIGVICIFIGISNAKGNISSLHSYHRKRVSEKDVLPFGKKVGLGMIIIGITIIINSGLNVVTFITENDIFMNVGLVIMVVGFVVAFGFIFYAMIKYNKGIF